LKDTRSARVAPAGPADGGFVRGRSPARPALAIRTEMGWLPVSDISRQCKGRAAIEVWSVTHTLFPGTRISCRSAEGETLRARQRDCRAAKAGILFRRFAATYSSSGESGEGPRR